MVDTDSSDFGKICVWMVSFSGISSIQKNDGDHEFFKNHRIHYQTEENLLQIRLDQ